MALTVALTAACGARAPAPSAPSPRAASAPSQAQGARTPFRAVLFPYIPDSSHDDFATLISTLESGFEAENPNVDLTIVIDKNMDLYDLAPDGELSKLLGTGPNAAQVVELDTILMTSLVAQRWVQPVGVTNPGVYATAWKAATVDNTTYGVPTYMCTNVVYAFSKAIQGAANATNLLARLASINPANPPLIGVYKGSWTLPSFYVDAWADTNGANGMQAAYQLPLQQQTMAFFPSVVNSCVTSSKNPCLDGTYDDDQVAARFANGQANGLIGYTESLFAIRSANPSAPLPQVISDPIGGGTHPSLFVDALVFNPACTGDCLTTAQAFASYMSTVDVRATIAFSLDGKPGTLPRYLLQASKEFYQAPPASQDPMYRAYAPIAAAGVAFPNTNFPQARVPLNKELQKFFADSAARSAAAAATAATP